MAGTSAYVERKRLVTYAAVLFDGPHDGRELVLPSAPPDHGPPRSVSMPASAVSAAPVTPGEALPRPILGGLTYERTGDKAASGRIIYRLRRPIPVAG